MLGVGMPAGLRIWVLDYGIQNKWLNITLFVVSIAIVLSYITFSNLAKFPKATEAAFIFLTLAGWYGVAAVVLLFSRIHYSGYMLASSFVISLLWFYGTYFWSLRARRPKFAIIPGGAASGLVNLPDAKWTLLEDPHLNGHANSGVVADLREAFSPEWERFITDISLAGVPVYHCKQVYETLTGRVAIEQLSENTFGSLVPGLAYIGAKRIVDFIAALVLLPLFAPLFGLIGLVIRHDSPGPVLFRQKRMGYRGQTFTVYKFRTMFHEPGEQQDAVAPHRFMTRDNDDRITRVGRWLRKWRLDEFPQMFNVLRGEMSFIGQRPEAVALSRWYEDDLPFYRYRHIVRPGITGWAQINQGHVTDKDLVLGKLHYDFYYIKNFSPWLDALITLKTVVIMMRGIGAR